MTAFAGKTPTLRAGGVLCAVVLSVLLIASLASAHAQEMAYAPQDAGIVVDGHGGAAIKKIAAQGDPDHGHADICGATICAPDFLPESTVVALPSIPVFKIAGIDRTSVSILSPPPLRPPRITA